MRHQDGGTRAIFLTFIVTLCLQSTLRRKFNVTRHIRAVHPAIPGLWSPKFYSNARFGTGDNTEKMAGECTLKPVRIENDDDHSWPDEFGQDQYDYHSDQGVEVDHDQDFLGDESICDAAHTVGQRTAQIIDESLCAGPGCTLMTNSKKPLQDNGLQLISSRESDISLSEILSLSMNELKSTMKAVENAILKLTDVSESQRKLQVSNECSDYDSGDEFSGSWSNDEDYTSDSDSGSDSESESTMTKNLQHQDSDSDQDDACIYPEAGMTVKEHARTVLAYATKHDLSQQALKGLLKLLQLHLPDGNKAAEKLEDLNRIAGHRNEI